MRYTCHLHVSRIERGQSKHSRSSLGDSSHRVEVEKVLNPQNIKGMSQREMFHATSMFQSASPDAVIHVAIPISTLVFAK